MAAVRWSTVCKLARRLPEVEEGRIYGVPALRVRGSLVARLLDDGKSIALKVGLQERAALCTTRPETFEVPADQPHQSTVVVRLPAVDMDELWRLLVGSWRRSAPPSLVAQHDQGPAGVGSP